MRSKLLTLLTFSVMTAPALAQMNQTGMMSMNSKMSGTNASAQMMDMSALSGKAFDRAFLSMMIPHHQAAVAMSRAVLGSRDARIRGWANTIIKDQNREINQMNTMLKSHGGVDSKMQASMKSMMGNMGGNTSNKDRAFVEGMISHHVSAIDMANLALKKSTHLSVLKLARDIIQAQAGEVYEFKAYLLR